MSKGAWHRTGRELIGGRDARGARNGNPPSRSTYGLPVHRESSGAWQANWERRRPAGILTLRGAYVSCQSKNAPITVSMSKGAWLMVVAQSKETQCRIDGSPCSIIPINHQTQ
ncbi:MAG: hypothetical protein ACI97A_001808 [Planctomycetota bacterium]|jgi:hypothetical protein